jgi:sterol desaturase/sphingolipid hydroxylase (fatty acid hydroxylase superfamily)
MALLDLHPDGLRAAEEAAGAERQATEANAGAAATEDTDQGATAARARIPLFRRPWVDRWLTRTWPPLVFVAYAGVLVALLGPPLSTLLRLTCSDADGDAAAAPWHFAAGTGLLLGGVLAWTLVEYALHRFGLHLPTSSRTWRVAYFLVHGHHHHAPRDAARTVATPWQSGSLLTLLGALAWSTLGRTLGPTAARVWLAGAVLGYLAYEALHLAAHHTRPRSRLVRALLRHHLAHHAEPSARYGISSPLWDAVFGTLTPRRARPRPNARGAR